MQQVIDAIFASKRCTFTLQPISCRDCNQKLQKLKVAVIATINCITVALWLQRFAVWVNFSWLCSSQLSAGPIKAIFDGFFFQFCSRVNPLWVVRQNVCILFLPETFALVHTDLPHFHTSLKSGLMYNWDFISTKICYYTVQCFIVIGFTWQFHFFCSVTHKILFVAYVPTYSYV